MVTLSKIETSYRFRCFSGRIILITSPPGPYKTVRPTHKHSKFVHPLSKFNFEDR